MKRLLAGLLVVLLLFSAALAEVSPAKQYDAAAVLMMQGAYDAASEAFQQLSGYSDAPQMSIYCRGLALVEAGDFVRAEKAFASLPGFKDTAMWIVKCRGYASKASAMELVGSGTLTELLAAESMLLETAAIFDEIDYLPQMAEEAAVCRAMLQPLTTRRFDGLGSAEYGFCEVYQGDKVGLVNAQGQLVIPCEWDNIVIFPNLALVWKGEKIGMIGLDGEMLWPCKADRFGREFMLDENTPTLYWDEVLENGQIEEHFCSFLPDGTALPQDVMPYEMLDNDLVRVYDRAWNPGLYHVPTQTMVMPCGQQQWMLFADGFIVQQYANGELAYFSAAGEPRSMPENAWPVSKAGIWHIDHGESGRIEDFQGNVLFEGSGVYMDYSVSNLPDEWIAFRAVEDGHKQEFLMDGKGKILLQMDDILKVFSSRYALCQAGEVQQLMDLEQENRLLVSADSISSISHDRFVTLTEDDVKYMLDLQTGVRFEAPYETINYLGEGMFKAKPKDGLYVLLNASGQRLNQETYDFVYSFKNGYLMVEQNDVYSMLDTQGNVVVTGYKYIFEEEGGLYSVQKNGRYGILDAQLNELMPCNMYVSGSFYGDAYWTASTDKIYNTRGEVIMDVNDYDDWAVGEDRIYILENKWLSVYDLAGNLVE